MSTFMQKKESVVRKWYILDAANKPLGKTAVAAADLLRGKNAPEFTPHIDCGNFVIVINADKAILTGKKLEQKMSTKPELAMEQAIEGMLPKNTLGAQAYARLKVYAGEAHKHEAQKPEAYEF